MDVALYLKAVVLGVVEGLTEFLPVSSTGHLIVAGQLIGYTGEKAKVFEIVIQSGAMLAVIWEYRARFGRLLWGLHRDPAARRLAVNLAAAFAPAALLGLAFGGAIKEHLFHAVPVAAAFIIGGAIILWVERSPRRVTVDQVDDMTWRDALKVGLAQAFALIPGTSRAGATIIGGMLFGLSRRAATEFSFFLAVPTLIAAGAYDFYRNRALFDAGDLGGFAAGFIVSFVCAFLCVRWLLRYIATHDFSAFAWYRIAFGVLVLATGSTGLINWSA
ncbi:MAG: undecaprenyl-diphosphate phosphatase [Burkholderiales bacterium]